MLIESFSGIRGIYKKDLNPDTIEKYAFAFYKFLKEQNKDIKIVIGSDTRESSEEIKEQFINVLTNFNCQIIDLGFNTTPAIEVAVRNYRANAGIIITASHNPVEYNGFKFLSETGAILNNNEIKEIIKNSKTIKLEKTIPNLNNIKNMHEDSINKYIDFLTKTIGDENIKLIKNSNIKILLDPNGGSACIILNKLFDKIGLKPVIKNNKIGLFNREIEPNEKSLSYLIQLIEKENFDFAAGFDCDADRIDIVTDKVISGQYVLALIVNEILSETKKNTSVVVNDATSYLIKEITESHKSNFIEVETGEINIINKMRELNATIGGEGSNGGVVFPKTTCRDGILALLTILKIIAKSNKKLNNLIKELPIYYTLNLKVNCDPKKYLIMKQRLKQYFSENNIKETPSGLKILFDNSWLWYRASKTEKGIYKIYSDSNKKETAENLLKKGKVIFEEIEKSI